jgi:hypothetical protein
MPYKDPEVRRQKQREAKARKRREDPDHDRALRRSYYRRHAKAIADRNLEVRSLKRDHAVARAIVQRALAGGELTRGKCEIGSECFGVIEGHHDDYSKPLEVRWLCKGHHMQLHAASFGDRNIPRPV